MSPLRELLGERARWWIAGASVVLLGALWWAIPALSARALTARAESYGFEVSVGQSRFGLGRLWIRDLVLRDAGGLGSVRVNALELRPALFGASELRAHGLQVQLVGPTSALRARWRALSASGRASGDAPSASASRVRPVSVDGLDLVWQRGVSSPSVALWGGHVTRSADNELEFSADLLRVGSGRAQCELRALSASWARGDKGHTLSGVEVARAELVLRLGSGDTPRTEPAASTSDDPSTATGWDALRAALASLVQPGFHASVISMSSELQQGADSLRVGPSRLSVERAGDVLSLELLPHPTSSANTPLTLRARVPLAAAPRPAELELTGGPVNLETLGVREGDFGLIGVRDAELDVEARVTADPGDQRLTVVSKGHLEHVRLRREALSPREISGVRLGWRVDGSLSLKTSELELRDAELSLGEVRVGLSGRIARDREHTSVSLRSQMPLAACSAVLAAVPYGMAPLLDGIRMDGTFTFKGALDYDSANPSATRVRLDVDNQCRVREVPPMISPRRFHMPWRREVKGADGLPLEIESGPGTASWTNYEDISPHLETAVVVCEDGNFFSHRGFDYRAIENSIRMNIEAGKFLRGGSTVSMQLAKNLYLDREKNLSRKLQEAVFTLLLEQELSKHELMELYLNVIEFGPGIYGVHDAAEYYFDESPRDLSLGQSLYLASILPNPDVQHFLPDGRVSPGWSRYLQKLMRVAKKIRRISDDELAQGLAEEVAFRKHAAPRVNPFDEQDGASDDQSPPELEQQ